MVKIIMTTTIIHLVDEVTEERDQGDPVVEAMSIHNLEIESNTILTSVAEVILAVFKVEVDDFKVDHMAEAKVPYRINFKVV